MIGLLDFETQSEVDLRHCGGRNYAEHESTRVLCLVMSIERALHVWINGEWPSVFIPKPKLLGDREFRVYIQSTPPDVFLGPSTLVAHNADDFDRLLWEEKVSREPVDWVDTIHRARAAGLRGSLDELGRRFLNIGKDDVGKRVLHKLMTLPNKNTLPGNVGLVASYCIQDVLILEHLYEKLPPLCDFTTRILASHRDINSRGVCFDSELARKIISWGVDESENAKREIKELEPRIVDKLRSPQVMLQWLESEGVKLPDTRKETIEHFINDPDEYSDVEVPGEVFRILELRKSCLRITGAKLSNALASVSSDGRLRDSFTFHGAHTGRWSGRRVQLQNLPRGVPGLNVRGIIEGGIRYTDEAERLETLRREQPPNPVMAGKKITSHDVLSTLIRPCFYGNELLIGDYNAVECRGAAWVAGEEKLLEVFRNRGSPYETTASRIFGRKITKKDVIERFIGKETTLGATYQMSPGKFEKYLENKGVNLSSAGVTGEQCITGFRESYPKLVQCWYDLNRTALYTVLTGSVETVARCRMFMRAGNFHIELPSGRTLWYRKARVEKCIPAWGGEPINQIVYEGIRCTTNLFGGKILENCLGGDTVVITKRGNVPITQVVDGDVVWDGGNWVTTGGCVYRGKQQVGKWCGVSLTGDHLISDGNSWRRVTDLDEQLSQRCLGWAADSGPLQSFTQPPEDMDSLSVCVTAERHAPSPCGIFSGDARKNVNNATRGGGLSDMPTLSPTASCATSGSIGTLGSSQDALTPNVTHTLIMVEGESESIHPGESLYDFFLGMQKLSMGGTTPFLTLTAPTTIGDTCRGICDSLPGGRIATIDGNQLGCNTAAESIASGSSVTSYVRDGSPLTLSDGISPTEKLPNRLWTSTGQSIPVYDLLNCGENRRFAIITEGGSAIVHNCTQAICRDILAEAMVRSKFPGVLHAHDELVVGGPRECAREHGESMSMVPGWCEGFPLGVEYFSSPRYVKEPWDNSVKGNV